MLFYSPQVVVGDLSHTVVGNTNIAQLPQRMIAYQQESLSMRTCVASLGAATYWALLLSLYLIFPVGPASKQVRRFRYFAKPDGQLEDRSCLHGRYGPWNMVASDPNIAVSNERSNYV